MPSQPADAPSVSRFDGATVKIATYNVNGIRVRLPRLLDWLNEREPDVALLQEIKCEDHLFPHQPLSDMGYNIETHGQKGFNGVAVLSKYPLNDVIRGLPNEPEDTQSRWIEASIGLKEHSLRVCCLYLPNGNPADSEKYDYKIRWLRRLQKRASELLDNEDPLVIAGDYNVIPQAEDARFPDNWIDDALFRLETRTEWRKLLNSGLHDAYRLCHPFSTEYTFWDFQANAWQINNGIRIDHLLISAQSADLLRDCQIDRHVRGWAKPSDHVPIWVDLDC